MKVQMIMIVLGMLHAPVALAADSGTYPSRPIRFVMPYPVGGTIDMSGRMIAQQLGDSLGQQVAARLRNEVQRYAKMVKASGAKAN